VTRVTHTVLSSATREVVLGHDRPFVMIGERINPTGRKLLAEEMKAGDFSRVERDAVAQVQAGAHMLDVNAGIPLADEPAILAKTIRLVQSLVDVPLSIDSSIVDALEAGLAAYVGKPLVNSVTGEEERLERVLPLVRKYGAAVVAISNDDTGISEPTTGSRARTSSSTRSSCRSGRWRRRANRSSASCVGSARSSGSTRPVARRTSASGCPTASGSTPRSCRWRSRPGSRARSRTRSRPT
jgi:Pterin binding enzyme